MDIIPVLKNLSTQVKCGIFTNKQGDILIVQDSPLSSEIKYVEYDPANNSFSLVYTNGFTQNLGIDINENMKKNLKQGKEVNFAYIANEKIQSVHTAMLLIQNY